MPHIFHHYTDWTYMGQHRVEDELRGEWTVGVWVGKRKGCGRPKIRQLKL